MVSKSQLHQNDRLVQTSLKILSLFIEQFHTLRDQEEQTSLHEKKQEHKKRNSKREIKSKIDLSFGSNEIIKQVSNDRSYMFDAIKFLKKIYILKENKKWKPGEKKGIQLTLLGFEIADIVYNIDKYNKTYSQLEEIRNGKISSFYSRHKDKIDEIIKQKISNKQTEYKIDYKGILSDNEYLKKKDIDDIKYINHISYALTSLQINEFDILISSYAKIYYSYIESIYSNTLLFLQTIILHQINIQFNKWANTIVKEKLDPFTNLDEKEFNFMKLISRNIGSNYLDILKIDYSFDKEVEDKVKTAINIMLRISKPVFPGETYLPSLDKDALDITQSLTEAHDLTKINFSELQDPFKLIYLQEVAESENKKIQEFRKKIID